jgi:hypothetical protein
MFAVPVPVLKAAATAPGTLIFWRNRGAAAAADPYGRARLCGRRGPPHFSFSGAPTMSSVTGTGAAGTTTNVTVRDGSLNVTLALLNQYARTSILRAAPGCRLMKPARSSVSTIW